ncbi:apoptosis-associated speck-like protein containing a CARD isoform X2 [Lampris incognitus]|uniref:apoptosis-associated speck-like protein containing a CARD isoform X2 n=1 Tax=Lampris incognitus TaxID=2546036 RepID=UPI0024B4B317|nr:apoptosis-associated speck-like protein containing a CARD isoform X2 [Lampris incognitus]
MPPKTVKSTLLDAFEELDDSQMLKFCDRLLDRQDEPRVKRSAIQNSDRITVTNAMVSVFTERRAVRVAVEVLRDCSYNELADCLDRGLTRLSAGAPVAESMADDRHFVDKHQPALIQRVSMVAPIMDQLLNKKVINQEGYDTVMLNHATPQARMRELFSRALTSSGTKGKDVFLQILEENEPYLVNDLLGK